MITLSWTLTTSHLKIAAYLKDHPQPNGVAASDFDFSSPKIMQDTIPEIIEQQKDSANKNVR